MYGRCTNYDEMPIYSELIDVKWLCEMLIVPWLKGSKTLRDVMPIGFIQDSEKSTGGRK
jgi:hypothetical protein